MDTFLNDLWKNCQAYYDGFVALLPKLAIGLLVFLALIAVANTLRRFSLRRLTGRMDDPLLARFIARLIGTAVIILAVMMFLQIVGLGAMAVGILSTAGVGAFILGFAFKDIGENFLARVVLAFKRPFRVGDIVELNSHKGNVVMLNLRDTQIKTLDGKDIYIPNAMVVKNPVINYTIDGFLRLEFTIGLDYGADFSRAAELILKAVRNTPNVLESNDKLPNIMISNLAASTLNMTVYFWIDTFDQKVVGKEVKNAVIENVLEALEKEGFYLPAEILEVKPYKNNTIPLNMETNKTKTISNFNQ